MLLAENGSAGLALLQQERPNLIVLDLKNAANGRADRSAGYPRRYHRHTGLNPDGSRERKG